MTTLRLEHAITDFATWKGAFDADPVDRPGNGVRAHRIHRPVDDPAYVLVDLDFDSVDAARAFEDALRRLWAARTATPALDDARPRVTIVETVEVAEAG